MAGKENILVTKEGRKKVKVPVEKIVKKLEENKISVLRFGDEKVVSEGEGFIAVDGGTMSQPYPPCE